VRIVNPPLKGGMNRLTRLVLGRDEVVDGDELSHGRLVKYFLLPCVCDIGVDQAIVNLAHLAQLSITHKEPVLKIESCQS